MPGDKFYLNHLVSPTFCDFPWTSKSNEVYTFRSRPSALNFFSIIMAPLPKVLLCARCLLNRVVHVTFCVFCCICLKSRKVNTFTYPRSVLDSFLSLSEHYELCIQHLDVKLMMTGFKICRFWQRKGRKYVLFKWRSWKRQQITCFTICWRST